MKNAILLHLHYQDLWPEFWSYLKDIKDENTDLYVTVHTTDTEWYNDIKNNANEVFLIENKGMDFGGFLYVLDKIRDINYLTITKLHGKRGSSAFRSKNSDEWRKNLYEPLIKSKETYHGIIENFKNDNRLFICGNGHFRHVLPTFQPNINKIREVNNLLQLKELKYEDYIGGSMYILSKKYLDLFFNKNELYFYNNSQHGYFNNFTLGHVLENLLCSNVHYFGGKIKFL
jgi:lipopolysaccharide biosynthesis protein